MTDTPSGPPTTTAPSTEEGGEPLETHPDEPAADGGGEEDVLVPDEGSSDSDSKEPGPGRH